MALNGHRQPAPSSGLCRDAVRPRAFNQIGAVLPNDWSQRYAGYMMWPVAQRLMTRMYDMKPGTAAESRAMLEAELDWLDAKLADGRAYSARPKELSVHHSMKAHMLSLPTST